MNCVRWSHEQSDRGICAAPMLEKKIRHRSYRFSCFFRVLLFVYRLITVPNVLTEVLHKNQFYSEDQRRVKHFEEAVDEGGKVNLSL